MERVLVALVGRFAEVLEFSDDATIDPDIAVALLEEMAAELGRLDADEQARFRALLSEVASDEADDRRAAILKRLPAAFGLDRPPSDGS